jgi:hypothetical protein
MRVEGGSGGRTVARQQKQGRFVRREGEKERVILEGRLDWTRFCSDLRKE